MAPLGSLRLRVFAWEAALQSPSEGTLTLITERFTAAPPRGRWPKGVWPHSLLTVRLTGGNPGTFLHLITYLRDRLNLPACSGDACSAALHSLGLPEPGGPVPAHLRVCAVDPLAFAARKVVGQQAL